MQSTAVQFSPVKDGRRILGEKDSNACLSPANHAKQALSVTSTPVKRALFSNVSPKKLLPSPIFAGQKRTREQVDEIEVNDASVQAPRELHVESPPSTVKHESQQVSYNFTAMWDISNQNRINWLTLNALPQLSPESDAMEITNPAPSSQPKRDQPQEMDTTRSRSASRASDSDTRSIPGDPDARKVFIQEVSGVLHTTRTQHSRQSNS